MSFLSHLIDRRVFLMFAAKQELRRQFAGSVLGIVWAFLHPIVLLLVIWFFVAVGLKATSPMPGIPFIVWFAPALFIWNYFSESVTLAVTSVTDFRYFLFQPDFKISTAPLIKLMATSSIHLVFILILFAIALGHSVAPSWFWLQCVYYTMATAALALGVSYITASLYPFLKDVAMIQGIILQLVFWSTPILWDASRIPEKYRWLLNLNPAVYLAEGYRDSLFKEIGFWQKPMETLIFWGITIVILALGARSLKKFKPHFVEVLDV